MVEGRFSQGWLLGVTANGWGYLVLGLGYLAIGVASIVPGSYRPSLGFVPDTVEHVMAYSLIGALSVFVMRSIVRPAWLAFALALYAAVLEICQAFIPGRVASVEDFAASAVGAVIGISIAAFSRRQQGLAQRPTQAL